VFAAIERAIGDGCSASVSYVDFRLDHHIARKAVSPELKLLDHLGLVDIEPGPRLVNVFKLSRRWCTIDAVEAVRLAALAREVQPGRRIEKKRVSEPEPPPPTPSVRALIPRRNTFVQVPMISYNPYTRRCDYRAEAHIKSIHLQDKAQV
jgi:hypothetical protein